MPQTKSLPVGLTIDGDNCHVLLWAPNAKAVAITGDFNNWSKTKHPLSPSEERFGHWEGFDLPLKPGAEYQFAITTQAGDVIMRADPRARRMTNSVGNSVVYADDFDWGDDDFKMPSWNELVIYELHIGTYNVTEEGRPGTFASAIERLDHLVELGINCVEVMPVSEFAGDFSWGYNPAHPYAVEEAYGGPDAFKEFVKAAHAAGIAVILDVVYNHFGPSDLAIWQFDGWGENDKGGIYFYNDWRSDTPWGDTRPDYGRPEVRDYIHDNAIMWLEEFRCDGLRMDMIPYMRHVGGDENEGGALPDGTSMLQAINRSVRDRFPAKLTIAEDLHGNNFVTNDPDAGGCGFGSQWDADFVHPVRAALIEQNDENRSMASLRTALLRRYGNDFFKRVIYTESHDEISNGNSRVAEEIAFDGDVNNYWSVKRAGLGMAMTLTAPGIPMLFQGQALLEDKWFSDQDPLDWSRRDEFSGVFNQYQDLIRLRRNLTGRTRGLQGQHTHLLVEHEEDKVLAYVRWYDNPNSDGVLVILNFSNNSFDNYAIGLDQSCCWEQLFNGNWEGYGEFSENTDPEVKLHAEEVQDGESSHRVFTHIGPYAAYVFGICKD